ncbi:MAG: hypothetical protein JW740_02565 [Candidatus Zambryskibacteria bacterium]|nr:hypothetical protein [Candidatus Zambryskibacteria bacterium]
MGIVNDGLVCKDEEIAVVIQVRQERCDFCGQVAELKQLANVMLCSEDYELAEKAWQECFGKQT